MASKRRILPSQPSFSSGAIESIELYNFMTHARLSLRFNPKVNILTGVNGSGKSSVLQAMVLGLGGTAKTTKRGSSHCGEFIRHGEQKSIIKVTLHNEGSWPYKPEVYGPSIILVRTIFRTGGTETCLKSSGGLKIFSGGLAIEERKSIIDHFCIDVHNPINILQQEEAKVIFNNPDAKILFKMFYSGSRIKECRRIYDLQEQRNKEMEILLEKKRKDQDFLKEQIEKLREELGLTDEINTSVREDLHQKLFDNAVLSLEKQRKRCQSLQKSHENMKSKEAEILDTIQSCETEKAEAKGKKADKKGDLARAKENYEIALSDLSKIQTEIDLKNEVLANLDYAMKEVSWKIRDVRNKKRSHMLQTNEAKSVKEKETSIREKLCNSIAEKSDLELLLEAQKKQKSLLVNNLDKVCESKLEAETELEKLKGSQKGKSIDDYGKNFVSLLKKINEESQKFNRLPLGPLGLYIRLNIKNANEESLHRLIEATITKKVLRMFIVDSMSDFHALKSLMVECDVNTPIAIMDMEEGPYDVTKERSNAENVLLDYLHFENNTVFNLLIDLIEPNTIAVMEYEKVFDMWEKKQFDTLKKTSKIISKNGFIFSSPSVSETFSCVIIPEFTTASKCLLNFFNLETEVTNLLNRVKAGQKGIEDITNQISTQEENIRDCQQKIYATEELNESFKENLLKLEQDGTSLIESGENYSKLEDDFHDQQTEIKSKQKVLVTERSSANLKLKNASITAQKRKKVYEEALLEIPEDDDIINHKIKTWKQELDLLRNSLAKSEATLQKENGILKDKEMKHRKATQRLTEEKKPSEETCVFKNIVAEHINTLLSVAKEKKFENDKVSKELHGKLRESVIQMASLEREIYHLDESLKIFDEIVQKRKETLLTIRHPIARIIQGSFSLDLSYFKMQGNITLEWEKEMLSIKVQPNPTQNQNSDGEEEEEKVKEFVSLSALSGGERTVVLICFLGSLWANTLSPFRCLDEWDVFLDDIAREKGERQLVDFAKLCSNQVLLISPGSSQYKSGDDPEITIFEIKKH